jgi:hypothetical protein
MLTCTPPIGPSRESNLEPGENGMAANSARESGWLWGSGPESREES